MTTVLADFRLGTLVADSSVSDEDRVWSQKKVVRYRGVLYAFSGNIEDHIAFMAWVKGGKTPKFANAECLMLSAKGLVHFNNSITPQPVEKGVEAIGSGAKAAMCAYEALGWKDPARAVKIVCKHDAGSRTPVRTYRIKI